MTKANGPGVRFGVWVQGCSLACAGCFNPSTHAAEGNPTTVSSVLAELDSVDGLEGVTVSGGEPLEQPAALEIFLREVKSRGLSSIVLSGYTRQEIECTPALHAAVQQADVVVSGRYNKDLHLGDGLRGSSNKQYWFLTKRYAPDSFQGVPQVELLVNRNGEVTITGMRSASEVLT